MAAKRGSNLVWVQVMEGDPQVAYLLPINADTLDLCLKVKDGVLLSKFINLVVPDTIDMRAVNFPKGGRPLSLFQVRLRRTTLCLSNAHLSDDRPTRTSTWPSALLPPSVSPLSTWEQLSLSTANSTHTWCWD